MVPLTAGHVGFSSWPVPQSLVTNLPRSAVKSMSVPYRGPGAFPRLYNKGVVLRRQRPRHGPAVTGLLLLDYCVLIRLYRWPSPPWSFTAMSYPRFYKNEDDRQRWQRRNKSDMVQDCMTIRLQLVS